MAHQSKNLHYEKQEPTFLKRLRGQHGDDKRVIQAARPKNPRLATSTEDDEPTIVDGAGQSVTREEYQAMLDGPAGTIEDSPAPRVTQENATGPENEKSHSQDSATQLPGISKGRKQQAISESGPGQKRRKQGKVIRSDDRETSGEDQPRVAGAHGKLGTQKSRNAKKVKLSFDNEDAK